MKYHFTRQYVKKNNIQLVYYWMKDEVADTFTKSLKIETSEYIRTTLGMINMD